jgi:hypothetical protein
MMTPYRRLFPRVLVSAFVLASFCISLSAAEITPPEEFLGFKVGADFHLATYEQALGYIELLDGETPRLKVFDMGPTSFERRQKYAVISSEENMAKLDDYKEICRKLSLARGVSEEEARRMAGGGKAIVWIDGGLHAREVVGSHANIQLAYDLVSAEDPLSQQIRDNVILVLVWTNPDGMTLIADWYNKNVGTEYEMSALPVLYQKYAGHDNNRESHIANLQETRNTHKLVNHEWFPVLYYNQHQTGPFPARIWISPTAEPANPNVHPLVRRYENFLGTAGAKGLEDRGLSGVLSRSNYDFFFAGSVLAVVEGHNIPALLTETQGYGYATPHHYKVSEFPEQHKELVPGQFFPNPWKGGWWRFSDQCLYNLTVSMSVLKLAAFYKQDFLFSKWKTAHDVIERFKSEPPYGWIIPAEQRDPNTTALMLNRFRLLGFEIHVADEAFTHEGVSYAKGSYIIKTSQPFGLYVKNLLERQDFPDLRQYPHLWQGQPRANRYYDSENKEEILPPLLPYDNAGWTVPLMMGVESRAMSTPLEVPMHLVEEVPAPDATVSGSGRQVVFSRADNNSFRAVNRIQKAGGEVSVALDEFTLGGTKYPVGTFLAESGSISASALRDIASATHVQMTSGTANVKSDPLPKPKVAVYQSWMASMDAGWTNYLFDQYEFPYENIHDADVRAGRLSDRFDVIVLPDQRPAQMVDGHATGTMPPDYVGGMTEEGVANIKRFVEEGGTLVCNKTSLDLALTTFKLPIKNSVQGVPRKEFFVPGSILRVNYDTSHPLAYGMESLGVGYISGTYALEVVSEETEEDDETAKESKKADSGVRVVARFPDEPLLASGFVVGESMLRGKAAVIEAEVGRGRVVLFGFNVQNRAQAYATHKLLYNALFYRAK